MSALRHILGRRKAERESASQQDLDTLKAQVAGLTEERKEDKVLLKQMQNTWEMYAAQISDLQRENTEKGRLLIQQGTQLDNEIRERGNLVNSLTARANEIGGLQSEVSRLRSGSEKQGKRIGDLEHQVENLTKEADLVPPLREQLVKVQLLFNMYYQWAQQLASTLKAENMPVAELPPLDIDKIEARSWELAQVRTPGGNSAE